MEMEIGGTTSIDNLPTAPQAQTNNMLAQEENIKINNPINSQINLTARDPKNNSIMEQQTFNELVSGLQQASASGHTNLPSRDIPQETIGITQDIQTKVNHIPEEDNSLDYINNEITNQEIISQHKIADQNNMYIDSIFEEIQIPLLAAILFFIFQLPIVQKHLYKLIPSLFNQDGSANLFGYLFNSLLFGIIILILLKSLKYFSNI